MRSWLACTVIVAGFIVGGVALIYWNWTAFWIGVAVAVVGCIFGSVNSRADIPRLLNLYKDGLLDLDGMVTRTYPLEDINQGYQDMHDGKNIRGVLVM